MNLLDLIREDVSLRKVSEHDGGEWAGPCPLCQGTDRFRVWPNSPRAVKFWCRQCSLSGDAIQYLREVRHLPFRAAAERVGKVISLTDRIQKDRERQVKTRLIAEYWQWGHTQLRIWTEKFRALNAELEIATIGYRATMRRPDLYSEAETEYWEQRLADLYEALPAVEHTCDILTYDCYAKERFMHFTTERGGRDGRR